MTDIVMLENPNAKQITNLISQLLDLYERQLQDRNILIKEKEALGNLTQLLINQTKEFGQYEAGIRKRIQDCIKASADAEVIKIADTVENKINHLIDNSPAKIGDIAESMEKTLANFCAEKKQSSFKVMAAVIIGSVLSSLFFSWLMLSTPTLPLTDVQLNNLRAGEMLVQIWPKLSKQEKNRLKALSDEVLQVQ